MTPSVITFVIRKLSVPEVSCQSFPASIFVRAGGTYCQLTPSVAYACAPRSTRVVGSGPT